MVPRQRASVSNVRGARTRTWVPQRLEKAVALGAAMGLQGIFKSLTEHRAFTRRSSALI